MRTSDITARWGLFGHVMRMACDTPAQMATHEMVRMCREEMEEDVLEQDERTCDRKNGTEVEICHTKRHERDKQYRGKKPK